LFEIVAAVVGVVLTALIGIKIRGYRNLVTYEVTKVRLQVAVADGQIVPFEQGNGLAKTISSYSVTIVNRGWKNLRDVRLHANGNIQPFSVEKKAASISTQTVAVVGAQEGLEISIEFMPSKEEVTVSFSAFSDLSLSTGMTGAGENYRVESIHFYIGQQQAIGFLKGCLIYVLIGAAVGLGLKRLFHIGWPPAATSAPPAVIPKPSTH